MEYLFTVDPGVSNPPPKVRSAVISMKRNDVSDLGCNEKLFKRVVKGTFIHRRKMLRVTLKQLLREIDMKNGKTADHAEFLANPQLTRRPEQLSVKEFVALTNSVAEECGYVAEE